MKISWILALCFTCPVAKAQLVNVTVTGEQNLEVVINHVHYETQNRMNNASKNFSVSNLRPGQYTMHLLRRLNSDGSPKQTTPARTQWSATLFTVRDGFEVAITVAPNGIVQVKEKQVTRTIANSQIAMSDEQFRRLLDDVRYHWRNTRKITAVQTALQNNNNFFTSAQLVELINSVSGEENRVTLAKTGYTRLTDPRNFPQVYELLEPASRTELGRFIHGQGASTITSFSETFSGPMNNETFEGLLDKSRRNMDPSTRVNEIAAVITNQTQYFTVEQVRRLIELVDFETSRLQLLKAVYPNVSDPWNFAQLYSLLTTDAARIELIERVKTTAANGGLVNYNHDKPALEEDDFTRLITSAREHSAAVVFLTEVFNDIKYNFSSAQAAQLITLAEGEASRLSLAKAAYRTIIDPQNYLALTGSLLHQPSSRNDLLVYVYSFRLPN